ncbi:MAG: nucleotidyltransferase family protein [Sulfuritalea sp.]|nr:nucleotidyltransferase family protein [Sulfuritalea sp.]
MKNQYFGDKRDLFKFDLMLDLMESGGFERLTYVPMLTASNSGSREGNLVPKDAKGHRLALFEFLDAARSNGNGIRNWHRYFDRLGSYNFDSYRDRSEDFSHATRETYFAGIDVEMLRRACILIDPDIGVERGLPAYMNRYGREKYLFLDELEAILDRADGSLIIVYQHLQKDARKRLTDIGIHLEKFAERLGLSAVPFVREGDLAFYAVTREDNLRSLAARTFSLHAEKTGRLRQHVTDVLGVAKSLAGSSTGVADLAVFGSVARGEQGAGSDIDVMVRFDRPATLRGYFKLQTLLEGLLGRQIDLVTAKALRPEMRSSVERDAVYAA